MWGKILYLTQHVLDTEDDEVWVENKAQQRNSLFQAGGFYLHQSHFQFLFCSEMATVWQLSLSVLSKYAEFSSTLFPAVLRRTELPKPLTRGPWRRLRNCKFLKIPFLYIGSFGRKAVHFLLANLISFHYLWIIRNLLVLSFSCICF